MIMVDSDIIIWILRGKNEFLDELENKINEQNESLFITPIQIPEILSGTRASEMEDTDRMMKSFNILDINENIGKIAGKYLKKYRKSHGITLADSLIAASAILNKTKLWTLNRKHYPMLSEESFE